MKRRRLIGTLAGVIVASAIATLPRRAKAAALYLKIYSRKNANAPDYVGSGQVVETYFLGAATYELPWAAGYVYLGGCTRMFARRVENANGALNLDISASQRSGCLQPYDIKYNVRPFSNSNSRILIYASGFVTWVTGTEGGITEKEGVVYSGIKSGEVKVVSENGTEVQVTANRMAIGDIATGKLTVEALPEPWLKVNPQGEVYSHPSNAIARDGQVYTVTNVAGETRRYRVHQWPRYNWQVIEIK